MSFGCQGNQSKVNVLLCSLLRDNSKKFRPIDADEHHWDRQSFHQPQDSEPGTSQPARPESDDIGIPVYVMLPLDTIRTHTTSDGKTVSSIRNEVALEVALHTLREAGVTVWTFPLNSEHVTS